MESVQILDFYFHANYKWVYINAKLCLFQGRFFMNRYEKGTVMGLGDLWVMLQTGKFIFDARLLSYHTQLSQSD